MSVLIPEYIRFKEHRSHVPQHFVAVERLENFQITHGRYHHAHQHPDLYQICWVTSGEGTHWIGEEVHSFLPNSLYCLAPGIVHSCVCSPNLRGFVLHFSKDVLLTSEALPVIARRWLLSLEQRVTSVEAHVARRLTVLFTACCREYENQELAYSEVLEAYLTIIITDLARQQDITQAGRVVPPVMQGFIHLVQRHIMQQWRVGQYATALQVTPDYLNTLVRATFGLSAKQYLQKRLIQRAKEYLLHSNASIAEVAYQLNFNDANYFSRFFKQHTGHSPKQYRAQAI